MPLLRSIRQKTIVSHLELSRSDAQASRVVSRDIEAVTLRIYASLVNSEISALETVVVVAIVWRSYFAIQVASSTLPKLLSDVIIETKNSGQGFIVTQSAESCVPQFFRHCGHPIDVDIKISFRLL